MELASLLRSTFGFSGFRANQEAVCRAATDGRDVLLVMPTGAGKSLCYQLPAVARGGTGLVVSPLIALMDDQANKLEAAGLRVARIHSGMSRESSRQACRDYLDGTLQFLFIAPERMRVPGFPEMLAKRKPALIAIDEAHCISAWGHDFRPDYRTLGEHLPALRPSPIIALTATATPAVQQDIVAQLQLQNPALFIHGFRRDNLHIEVVELSKPRRPEFIADFLAPPERRPAIVYASARKTADELAGHLHRTMKAAVYHAGLDAATRERVQRQFLAGELEVVVATVAFGMGVDKADVRTVMHSALPASVEAYYQEIGRAGRDGEPSRTVLLYSYADRRVHEFLLDQSYPPLTDLQRVEGALLDDFLMPEALAAQLRMSRDVLARSLEKLAGHGVAQIDMSGNVRRSAAPTQAWQSGYGQQIAFRRAQIDRIMAFAETPQCRMTALIRHFGDQADGSRPCGHCDVCAPGSTLAQQFVAASGREEKSLRTILHALDGAAPRATGRLFTDTALGLERKEFDSLLDGLSRAGLVSLQAETFTNGEGKVIPFKKVSLTYEGQTLDPGAPLGVMLSAPTLAPSGARTTTKTRRRDASGKQSRLEPEERRSAGREAAERPSPLTPAQEELSAALKGWRKSTAAANGRPAFFILSDAVLHQIVLARPTTLGRLAEVRGIGQGKIDQFGAEICAICREPGSEQPPARSASVADASGPPAPGARDRRTPAAPQQTVRESAGRGEPRAPAPVLVAAGPGRRLQDPEAPAHHATGSSTSALPAAARLAPPAADAFTADQQALELRLRDWRKTESERIGLPQFFVLGTLALRNIVLERPSTMSQLQDVAGLAPEKVTRFGASILSVCNS